MPDNNIEWGQGGVNNNNDWGKAKANSANSFGAVYDSSPSGDTNIVGGTTLSAAFNYSASAYCQDASDPTPTITGTSGGTFTAAEKYFPFQMQFEVAPNAEKTITIPKTVGSSYTVDWGDGTTTTESGSANGTDISHTYNPGGVGTTENPIVSIGAASDTGQFTMFKFNNGGSKSDLLDVLQWGDIVFHDLYLMFQGCNNVNFQISATDAPTFANTTSLQYLSYAFNGATYFNSDINHWDVSKLTAQARNVFDNATNFNQNLSSWVVKPTYMPYFFIGTSMSGDSYTDTLVGWAVTVYKNSGTYNVNFSASYRTFIGTKTSDAASGQTYATKYGSDWTATGWTTAQDAKNYLTTTAGWSIN